MTKDEAIEEAIYVLADAIESGRISGVIEDISALLRYTNID